VKVQLHALLNSALDGGEWSVSYPVALLPAKKSPWYQLNWSLGGPQRRYERGGEEKIYNVCRESKDSVQPSHYTELPFVIQASLNMFSL
jgi:hypothetical protein